MKQFMKLKDMKNEKINENFYYSNKSLTIMDEKVCVNNTIIIWPTDKEQI